MHKRIETEFIINQYRSGIKNYSDFTKEVGLWISEKYVFEKYLKQSYQILDLGCGTGRTTIPLFMQWFENIIGIDLTPEMIFEAIKLNSFFGVNIDFRIGDACNLDFRDSKFDAVIFSFNGLMSIPKQSNRNLALKEINRVLKESGIFIFTPHDRDKENQFLEFWSEERERWNLGKQNSRLYEFGDILAKSKNESRDIFIHIPDKDEIINWVHKNGFEIIETFYRSDEFEESELVKSKSGECRFWIIKKKSII
jgi:ubiquinone/menaquinone biosynthesis C-methylase UbiE